jgi:hypothetical protein
MVEKKVKKKTTKLTSKKVVKKKTSTKINSKKKTSTKKKVSKSIRDSRKWIELERIFKDEQHNFSSKEKYHQYIDSLMEITVDQKNLLGSFNKFIASKKG